ncbi:MAG: beta/gamma crystallin-related protein [Betaproteobacteria bacterium]
MNKILRNLLLAAGILVAGQAAAQVTFYQGEGFRGPTFTADRDVWNFDRYGFNDRASSVSVRGGRWEVCTDARFNGNCVVLRPGDYPSLAAMGLNDQISSARELQHYGNNYEERRERGYYRDDTPYRRGYERDFERRY